MLAVQNHKYKTFLQQQLHHRAGNFFFSVTSLTARSHLICKHSAKLFSMATHEEMVRCLNDDFDNVLSEMKSYVLQLQLKSERQRCALWIKKLCEANQFSGLDGRRLRNNYSKALLNMLRRGIMEGPLLHRPPEGKLAPFPAYLEEYLREFVPQPADLYPDWLEDLDTSANTRAPIAARQRVDELLASHRFEEQLDSAVQPSRSPKRSSPGKRRSLNSGIPVATNAQKSSLDEITIRRTASSGSGARKDSVDRKKSSTEGAFQLTDSDDEKQQEEPGTEPEVIQSVTSSEDIREIHRDPRDYTVQDTDTRRDYNFEDDHRSDRYRRSTSRSRASRSPVSRVRSPDTRSPDRRSPPRLSYYTRTRPIDNRDFDREVELKVKVIENRLYEDKLQIQQKTDEEIQKILERKNSEIDELKSEYRKKMAAAEDQTTKLERKVSSVLKDAKIIQENKNSQIAELKKMVETTALTQTNNLEKRIHDLQAEHEQEKIELQKTQTASIQQLMDDTSTRLCKMEEDYRKQSKAMADTIRDLEKRLQTLTLEAERISSSRQQLEQNKIELESRCEQLAIDNNDFKQRIDSLERELRKSAEDHKHTAEMATERHETQLSFAKKELQLQLSKSNDSVMALEQHLIHAKQGLADEEALRQRQVRELEQTHKQDKLHTENLHDKKVRSLQKEMEQTEAEHKKKVKSMERSLADKEKELDLMKDSLKAQQTQAEGTLKDLRREVEQQQEQTFADMRRQIQDVENELEKSRSARLEQTKEFERRVEEIKSNHSNDIRRLTSEAEARIAEAGADAQHARENLMQQHKQELELLKKNYNSEKSRLEEKMKQRRKDGEAKIGDLSEQIADLKDELAQSENMRKQQLMEIGMAKDEETQKLNQEHKRAVDKIKSDFETEKLQLQKQHSGDMESQLEKTNNKLKLIERDYQERIGQQAEQIADLELQLEQLQTDKHKLVDELESRNIDNTNRWEEEKRLLRKQSASNSLTLKQEIESLKTRLRQAERDSQNNEADHEEELVHLRLEYEEKMKGLMPKGAREQLEATVNSLKNQVNTLKQRIAILQDN